MSTRSRCLLVLAFVLLPAVSWAFKIETHVWVSQQVLNDVTDDGRVTIEPFGTFAVKPEVAAALQEHPSAFRMGAIGPDAFPDLVGGQLTTHPGVLNGWVTDDWLNWVLSGANSPEERAFAFGFLTHAAGDIFAHTYVNGYVGDHFEYRDGPEEEYRHMGLEDFIKQHMPPIQSRSGAVLSPTDIVSAPAPFIARRLILDPAVAAQYRRSPGTRHLASMYDAWAGLSSVIHKVEDAKADLAREIQSLERKIEGLEEKIDDIKGLEIDVPLVGTVKLWPAYCFLDPGTCLALQTAEATLLSVRDTLRITRRVHDVTVAATLEPLRAWRSGMERAVEEYVRANQRTAIELMKPSDQQNRDPLRHLSDWVACWAPVFAGVPSSLGSAACASRNFLTDTRNGIADFRSDLSDVLGPLGWAVDPAQKVSELFEEEVKPELEQASLDLTAALIGTDNLLYSFVQMRLTDYDAQKLNQEFGHDDSSKGLLEISDISGRVLAEMHLDARGHWDPARYAVVHNAIVLAKLVLLPAHELNRLVELAGIGHTVYGPALYADTTPFSLLFGAVRSIDGSHQWQEFALPYPRRAGSVDELWLDGDRAYGRKYDGENGFRLWQDCGVRKRVFTEIFKGPIAPGLENPSSLNPPFPEVLSASSPFRASATNPFPLSSKSRLHDAVAPEPDRDALPALVEQCPAKITTRPTATDVCEGPVTGVAASPVSFPKPGQYEILWRYSDGTNTSTQLQQVRVVDALAPAIQVSGPIGVEQQSLAGTRLVLPEASATDGCDGEVAVTNDAPEVFPLGTTVVTYRAEDAAGNVARSTVRVTVVDTTAPMLAQAPPPVRVEQASLAGTKVELARPRATDICDAAPVVTSDAPATFPLGTTVVRFSATDDSGNMSAVTTQVTVEDTTAPRVAAVRTSVSQLWPPDHRLVPVTVSVEVKDICDAAPQCRIVQVASNEAADVAGSGNTAPDWVVRGDLRVDLRAERSGKGPGRVYSLTVRCTDQSGNSTLGTAAVTVIHDRS